MSLPGLSAVKHLWRNVYLFTKVTFLVDLTLKATFFIIKKPYSWFAVGINC